MSILSGRKVETHEPGTLGSFGGWRDPKELENQADHAHRYYGRETPLDELEQRERLPQPRRHRPRQSRDPLALADSGAANVETWTRDATGVITFLRRPRKDEPGTLTELEHQHAARNREAADTEKARRRFLKDQQPQPVLRRDTSMSLKDALATIEHHEGRVTIGDYGELVVAVPARSQPHLMTPSTKGKHAKPSTLPPKLSSSAAPSYVTCSRPGRRASHSAASARPGTSPQAVVSHDNLASAGRTCTPTWRAAAIG